MQQVVLVRLPGFFVSRPLCADLLLALGQTFVEGGLPFCFERLLGQGQHGGGSLFIRHCVDQCQQRCFGQQSRFVVCVVLAGR